MAVDFSETEHTRTSEYLILPKDLTVVAELNGRVDLPDIEWLIESMAVLGQIQPIAVRNDNGKAVVVVGHSRWRAAIEINKRKLTPVPFRLRCVYLKGNDRDGFLANIAENHVRTAPTELDDAHNIAQLEKWGQTIEQIAAVYHKKTSWVRRLLKLTSLTAEAQQAIKEGRLKITAAVHIAKLSAEQQRDMVRDGGKVKLPSKARKSKKADVWEQAGTLEKVRKITMKAFEDSAPKSEIRSFCEKLLDLMGN